MVDHIYADACTDLRSWWKMTGGRVRVMDLIVICEAELIKDSVF